MTLEVSLLLLIVVVSLLNLSVSVYDTVTTRRHKRSIEKQKRTSPPHEAEVPQDVSMALGRSLDSYMRFDPVKRIKQERTKTLTDNMRKT